MSISRREFVKSNIAAVTASTVGIPVSQAAGAAGPEEGWQWDKSVCRPDPDSEFSPEIIPQWRSQ